MKQSTGAQLDRTGSMVHSNKTVLIVDDDRVFSSSLSDGLLLMLDDVSVYTAENGEQALSIIKTSPVDLVITDLRMHKMDGRELVLWMNEIRPAMPVIVMSAYADPRTVIDLEMQGISFFDKPLDLSKLTAVVRSLLS